MVAGLNDAFAPAGRPVALRVMFCAAPLVSVVVIELVPLCPAVTVTVFGLAAIEKSSATGALTVRVSEVVWVAVVPVPVIVTVDDAAGVAVVVVIVIVDD